MDTLFGTQIGTAATIAIGTRNKSVKPPSYPTMFAGELTGMPWIEKLAPGALRIERNRHHNGDIRGTMVVLNFEATGLHRCGTE